MLCIKTYTPLSDLTAEEISKLLNKFLEYNIPKKPLFVDNNVYDLLNCLILDYTNCPKTAQFYAQNGSLISPEYSGDITLSNYFVKFF